MREIKFRAWDKKSKKMRTLDTIAFHGNGAFDIPTRNVKLVNLWGRDCIEEKPIIVRREVGEFELMQYTELKDIGGKELYYDDIINVYYGHRLDGTEAITTLRELVSLIDRIDESGACFMIVGNIHEHQNLLKGADNP